MKRLSAQLTLRILFLLLVTIGAVGLFANLFINKEFAKYITQQEKKRSESIVADLSRQYNTFERSWNLDYVHMIGMYSLYDGYIIKVYDKDGEMVWDAENHDTTLCGEIMADITARMKERGAEGGFITQELAVEQNGRKVGTAAITYYGPYFLSEGEFSFIRSLNKVLFGIAAAASLLAVLVGYLLARRIAHPIKEAADIAKRIAAGNYDIKIDEHTNTLEIGILIEAIHGLAAALQKQENLRRRLTTNVAHELRTPLTAVASHLEAMMMGLWEATPERLSGCYDEVQRLGNLVADLGQLAKIESENLQLNKERVDVFALVHTVAKNMDAEIRKKELSLTVLPEKEANVFIQADSDRLKQVVMNLLSNAIKYTKAGGAIQIDWKESPDHLEIMVQDSGIGIAQQELPLIFERFYRTDQSRDRKTGGAGIGLAIAKSIVEAHGGSLNVESEAFVGSIFTIRLPKA